MRNLFKNIYVVIAREISTDSNDNMVSIIKMIDKFTFQYDPSKLSVEGKTVGKDPITFMGVKYVVATSWYIDEKSKKETPLSFRVNINDPNGLNLGGPTQVQVIPAGFDKINFNLEVEGVPVTKPGKYKLTVELLSKAEEVLSKGEYPFLVELIEVGAKISA